MISGDLDYQLVQQTTEWQAPARYDDVLEATARVVKLGTTSMTLAVSGRLGSWPFTRRAYSRIDIRFRPLNPAVASEVIERLGAGLARALPAATQRSLARLGQQGVADGAEPECPHHGDDHSAADSRVTVLGGADGARRKSQALRQLYLRLVPRQPRRA